MFKLRLAASRELLLIFKSDGWRRRPWTNARKRSVATESDRDVDHSSMEALGLTYMLRCSTVVPARGP